MIKEEIKEKEEEEEDWRKEIIQLVSMIPQKLLFISYTDVTKIPLIVNPFQR